MKKGEMELTADIYAFDSWSNNKDYTDSEVILGIGKFYSKYKKVRCDKKYETAHPCMSHFSYFMYLYKIKAAIAEKKYQTACNEIISLIHYEPFRQVRIKNNLLQLLEESFGFEKTKCKKIHSVPHHQDGAG